VYKCGTNEGIIYDLFYEINNNHVMLYIQAFIRNGNFYELKNVAIINRSEGNSG